MTLNLHLKGLIQSFWMSGQLKWQMRKSSSHSESQKSGWSPYKLWKVLKLFLLFPLRIAWSRLAGFSAAVEWILTVLVYSLMPSLNWHEKGAYPCPLGHVCLEYVTWRIHSFMSFLFRQELCIAVIIFKGAEGRVRNDNFTYFPQFEYIISKFQEYRITRRYSSWQNFP